MTRYVTMGDLIADMEVNYVVTEYSWRYVEPPKLVFVPSQEAPFLPGDSNKLESVPKDCP